MANQYNISDIPIPTDISFTEMQLKALEAYHNSYHELEKYSNDRGYINSCLNSLASFLKTLDSDLQNKLRLWYKYQLTFIDPTLVASLKISQIASAAQIGDNFAIDEDGTKFYLMASENNITNIQNAIEEFLPGLKYKTHINK